ncbi:MAG: dipeptidase PepV [Eubacteriales bacterium]|nr:dipeptidase PepV [Eubacteriales bacterium]
MVFKQSIDNDKNEIIRHIQKLVQIKSVQEEPKTGKPFGEGPYRALEYVLELAKSLGFESKNFDGYAGHVEYGNGDEIVGVLVHVDVVPEGSGWTYPPYSGEIVDGKIYGRGSYDDKGACIGSLYALKALKESGLKTNKKVRIIFGANEETGMKDIPYYLTKEKEPDVAFSPDAPFPVVYGEKGILELSFEKTISAPLGSDILKSIKGGTLVKKVAHQCEAVLSVNDHIKEAILNEMKNLDSAFSSSYSFDKKEGLLKIEIVGKEAYATNPQDGKNAIAGMLSVLGGIDGLEEELKIFIDEYNKKIGEDYSGERLGCDFTDSISTPLTFNPGIINYENNTLEMKVHIRYPITVCHTNIIDKIRENFSDHDASIRISNHSKAHYIDKDSFLVKKLMSVYKEETGDITAEPVTMTGGTYARTLSNAVAFGPLFPGERQVAHDADEYVNIDSIIKATKIYAKAIYELAK